MTKFVAAIFQNPETAEQTKRLMLCLASEEALSIHGLAIITRDAVGKLTIIEALRGIASDEGVCLLLTALSAVIAEAPAPALGLLTDLGSWGDLVDFGVTPNFIQKLAGELNPGKAAVLAEIDEDWTTLLDTGVENLGGIIIRTWRSEFEAEQLPKSSQPHGAAKAKHL
jgi:uncharacterized membrane protein